MSRRLWLLIVLLSWIPLLLGARTVVVDDTPITVRLQPLQPTALSFPEAIATIPTGVDPAQLSLEASGTHLFLQPLSPQLSGRLFVVGQSGRLYTVQFVVKRPADSAVVLTLPPVLGAQHPEAMASPRPVVSEDADTDSAAALLRLMKQAPPTVPLGIQRAAHQHLLRDDATWRVTTTQVYRSGAWLGYVATATNQQETPQVLALRSLTAPGLVAVHAATTPVPPQGQTTLYLVFGRP